MTRKELLFWAMYSEFEKFSAEEIDLHFEQLDLYKRIVENETLRKSVLNELMEFFEKP